MPAAILKSTTLMGQEMMLGMCLYRLPFDRPNIQVVWYIPKCKVFRTTRMNEWTSDHDAFYILKVMAFATRLVV